MTKRLKMAFVNLWTSYATYYFGKVNLSIVVPVLLVTYKDLSLYNVGLVSSGFFFAYAIGQFLHGQISERFNPFIYISAGLLLSGIMNITLGFSAGFFLALLLLETFDGFFQAMGWSSIVRANSIIQKSKKREKSTTILGTSYQVGNSVAWLISALVVGQWGWRWGFWVAAVFLIGRGLLLLATYPRNVKIEKSEKISIQLSRTLTTPIVLSGLGLCFLNMVRYGVITWIPLYLFQQGHYGIEQIGKVGLKVFLLPIAGVLGTMAYMMFKRITKDVLSMVCLICVGISLCFLPESQGMVTVLILAIGSFFLYGPHVFLVTTCPTRFCKEKIVAASTGFIDGMGYVGTVLIGIIVPFILTQSSNDWHQVFYFWAILSVVTAMLTLVNYLAYFRKRGQG